ncbi:MAG TPA: hypothetical protein VHM01_19805 [Alphaproteobacteria bacterium]|nr:hypothetical protein [Alphaproteobacteria bacterium]
MDEKQKDRGGKAESQEPFMPGDEARRRGEIPTGETRNKDYGKGRQSGIVSNKTERDKAQDAELDMNERNR